MIEQKQHLSIAAILDYAALVVAMHIAFLGMMPANEYKA